METTTPNAREHNERTPRQQSKARGRHTCVPADTAVAHGETLLPARHQTTDRPVADSGR